MVWDVTANKIDLNKKVSARTVVDVRASPNLDLGYNGQFHDQVTVYGRWPLEADGRRITLLDWPVIFISFVLAWAEFIVSMITILLPTPVLSLFTFVTTTVYRFSSDPVNFKTEEIDDEDSYNPKYTYLKNHRNISKEKYVLMTGLLNSTSINEMVELFGYSVEPRIVQTKDHYLLTVHRLSKPNDTTRVTNGKVVYLHHGLLMSSEIWVTMLDKYQNLPFILYDLGYDVWMGNNRGNKYSQKHLQHKLHTEQFWDFSLDEFALFDIPNTIDYILDETKKSKLTYIGFSQGTAQAFASVSINTDLNDKIDQLIAISPATTPHGLHSKFLDLFLKSSPNVFFLLFSRKILMPSVAFWQKIMYPPLFDTMIDVSNYVLFNWKSKNISKIQKLSSYAHLYSTTSVKSVVHWFQVMSSKNFQMYHDAYSSLSGLSPVSYPLSNIRIPIHLIYGSIDSLVDIDVMCGQLPPRTTTTVAALNHEHLDNIWGDDAYEVVFKHVLHYLGENEYEVESKLFRSAPTLRLIEDVIPEEEEEDDDEESGERTLANGHISLLKSANMSHSGIEVQATGVHFANHVHGSEGSVFV
ncbi:Triglyceride lipase-cholesterol esterase [Scheffersomyces stipitis CBS 6054]|uniref:Triglyceride lipase-cholesterol esterase n=1 Tax=Scheffersomyces stipitis (strain ATCC 58785 / CBS 6054 / NBRC 10063 / NRRL Y-11545) TaxID=322104 RepID=A3LMU3_PICST|nr:Triglyceride lipase-cholesterol esterase [Scheffersomyces stipitis CBS 6054]ABN64213.2 Triglyceride lipase-cholesterol esterase [Scheffersomyces stipitis CBS 6054]